MTNFDSFWITSRPTRVTEHVDIIGFRLLKRELLILRDLAQFDYLMDVVKFDAVVSSLLKLIQSEEVKRYQVLE
jgi:hypothetical protein